MTLLTILLFSMSIFLFSCTSETQKIQAAKDSFHIVEQGYAQSEPGRATSIYKEISVSSSADGNHLVQSVIDTQSSYLNSLNVQMNVSQIEQNNLMLSHSVLKHSLDDIIIVNDNMEINGLPGGDIAASSEAE